MKSKNQPADTGNDIIIITTSWSIGYNNSVVVVRIYILYFHPDVALHGHQPVLAAGLHSSCSIINNTNTSAIKTILNITSFPSLNRPCIRVHVEGFLPFYPLSTHRCCWKIELNGDGVWHVVVADDGIAQKYCGALFLVDPGSWLILRLLVPVLLLLLCCWIVVLTFHPNVAFSSSSSTSNVSHLEVFRIFERRTSLWSRSW